MVFDRAKIIPPSSNIQTPGELHLANHSLEKSVTYIFLTFTLKFSVIKLNNFVALPVSQAVFDIIISNGAKTLSLVIT